MVLAFECAGGVMTLFFFFAFPFLSFPFLSFPFLSFSFLFCFPFPRAVSVGVSWLMFYTPLVYFDFS